MLGAVCLLGLVLSLVHVQQLTAVSSFLGVEGGALCLTPPSQDRQRSTVWLVTFLLEGCHLNMLLRCVCACACACVSLRLLHPQGQL